MSDNLEKQEVCNCPCCGQPMKEEDCEVSVQTLEHFLSCAMTGVSFWKQYGVFSNRVKIQVTIPCAEDRDQLFAALTKLQNVFAPAGTNQHLLLTNALGRLLYIKKITFDRGTADQHVYDIKQHQKDMCLLIIRKCQELTALPADKRPALQDVYKQLLMKAENESGISGIPGQLLDSVIQQHNTLFKKILKQGLDKDFWEGIKRA